MYSIHLRFNYAIWNGHEINTAMSFLCSIAVVVCRTITVESMHILRALKTNIDGN